MTRHVHKRGFTLIELLVAISILAIVAVLGWRGLDSIVRARIALSAEIESTRGMQLAFAQMQSDAEHIASPGTLQGRLSLLADVESMSLVRNVYLENEPTRLAVVTYRVHDGVLDRRESSATRDLMQLDVLWRAATTKLDDAQPVVLQSNVNRMMVQTYVGGRWVMPGPVGGTVQPPTGLQVGFELKGVPSLMIKNFLLGGA